MTKTVTLERYPHNPIMKPNLDNSWEASGTFNPAAVMHEGKIHLLYRAADRKPKTADPRCRFGIATIGHAVLEDGYKIIEKSKGPVIGLEESTEIFGVNGVEDPRITKIGDTYYIVYAVTSDCWDRLALASTKDFKTYKRHGLIVKDIAQRTGGLFPEKINGKYILMHRPIPNIWISESSDLVNWENPRMILTNKILPWCEVKLGICAPPIKTEKAWAVIFHGVDRNIVYRLGIFWLDLEDPSKVLKVQKTPILEPETPYETHDGITGNCVYACGAVVDGEKVLVYYGAGDSFCCVATMPSKMLELPS